MLLTERKRELLLLLEVGLLQGWQLRILLELKQRSRQNVLKVDILESLAVEKHVVVDVEAAQQIIGVPFKHRLGNIDLHLLVEHQDRRALFVKSSSASSATHLDVLPSS